MQFFWIMVIIFSFLPYSSLISSIPHVIQISPKGLRPTPSSLLTPPARSSHAAPFLKHNQLPPLANGRSLFSSPPVFCSQALYSPAPAQVVSTNSILHFLKESNAARIPLASIDEKINQEQIKQVASIDEKMNQEKLKHELELKAKAHAEQLLQVEIDGWASPFMVWWKSDLCHNKAAVIKSIKAGYNVQDIPAIKQAIRNKINAEFEECLRKRFNSQASVELLKHTVERYTLKPMHAGDPKNSVDNLVQELNAQIDSLQVACHDDDHSGCCECCSFFYHLIRTLCIAKD